MRLFLNPQRTVFVLFTIRKVLNWPSEQNSSVLEGCEGGELESAPVDISVSPERSMKAALCERCVSWT